jgi:hypothetical protein
MREHDTLFRTTWACYILEWLVVPLESVFFQLIATSQ